MFVVAVAAIGVALMSACGTPQPSHPPTVVAVATTATIQIPTMAGLPDTVTPKVTDVPPASPTPTPTDTPSPVPPTPTDTPSPVPPMPTATRPPTDTPVPPTATVARPTKTPVTPTAAAPSPSPWPWRGQVAGTFSNCALTRLMGLTLDRNGGIAGDIWVHFWADGWEGAWARSSWTVDEGYPGLDDSSNWDGVLDIYPKAGTWYVCVVPAEGRWDCMSRTMTVQTVAEPCAPDSGGVQIVRIVFQQN